MENTLSLLHEHEHQLTEKFTGLYGDPFTNIVRPFLLAAKNSPWVGKIAISKEEFLRLGPITDDPALGIPHEDGAYLQANFLDAILKDYVESFGNSSQDTHKLKIEWFAKGTARFGWGPSVMKKVAFGFRCYIPVTPDSYLLPRIS